jgi:predicted membrane chloride channel (bestrophin family)
MENNKYLEFEKSLIHRGVHDNAGRMPGRWDKEVRKLFSVIMKVRSLARQVGFSVANPSQMDVEYLISLLMATLNVIRLRHIPRERKLQAIYAANLICDELAKKFTLSGI